MLLNRPFVSFTDLVFGAIAVSCRKGIICVSRFEKFDRALRWEDNG